MKKLLLLISFLSGFYLTALCQQLPHPKGGAAGTDTAKKAVRAPAAKSAARHRRVVKIKRRKHAEITHQAPNQHFIDSVKNEKLRNKK